MTVFDYITLGVLAASMLLGVWRGVIGEVFSLFGWVLGFLAAIFYGDAIAALLFSAIENQLLRLLFAWIVVFLLVLGILALLRVLVKKLITTAGLGSSDRALGILFGALRGLLVVVLLTAVGGFTKLPQQPWWQQAALSPVLENAVIACLPWLPENLAAEISFQGKVRPGEEDAQSGKLAITTISWS